MKPGSYEDTANLKNTMRKHAILNKGMEYANGQKLMNNIINGEGMLDWKEENQDPILHANSKQEMTKVNNKTYATKEQAKPWNRLTPKK